MSLRNIFFCLILLGVVLLGDVSFVTANAKERRKKEGETIYLENCEACHMMGKNVIKPGKDIVTSNKIHTLDEFEKFISEEHGLMPAFPELVKEKKSLLLYKFVKTLKNQDWTYEPPLDDKEKSPGGEHGKSGKKKDSEF